MAPDTPYKRAFLGIALLLLVCFTANISLGSVFIPWLDTLSSLAGGPVAKESWRHIIINYRLPKAFTAIIVGSGLGVSGLLMQTLFRNPLAGPFVLGISSGASLGVALLILGSAFAGAAAPVFLISKWGLVIAASLGSVLVLFAVVLVSARVRDTMAILIIGLMFGSITAAIVSVLSYFAPADQLQQYIFWGFGSLGNLSWYDVLIFFGIVLAGVHNAGVVVAGVVVAGVVVAGFLLRVLVCLQVLLLWMSLGIRTVAGRLGIMGLMYHLVAPGRNIIPLNSSF